MYWLISTISKVTEDRTICGIVGIIGTLDNKQIALFRDLWLVDVIRGEDSSGIAFINGNNHAIVVKDVGPPNNIIGTKNFQKGFNRNNICLIGHNRSATVGGITKKMSHPFQFKSVIGVHNGTLRSVNELPDHLDFTSDSENIFYSIDKIGAEKTWKKVNGAASLVWWDKKNKTLNLLKNEERPMIFTFCKTVKGDTKDGEDYGSFMAFASELWMLESLFKRHGLKHGTLWRPKSHIQFIFRYNQKLKKVEYQTEMREKWAFHCYEYVHKSINTVKDTFLGKNKETIRADKTMTVAEFRTDYKVCAFCDGDMHTEYLTSIIIDEVTAICGDCVSLGDKIGINLQLIH